MTRLLIVTALLAATGLGSAAAAQDLAPRVDKLEREMRAVQRKVFPGGAGLTVEPQITAPAQAPATVGNPAGTAFDDLTARVASIESQLTGLVGTTEQNQFKLRQLEEAFNAYKAATDKRLIALEAVGGAAPVGDTAASAPAAPAARPAQTAGQGSATRPAATRPAGGAASSAPGPATSKADPARVAAVAAVERPASGDAAEDGYTYGYRLWSAKFYPEAQAQLKAVADKYPKHRRASYSQNLLGRAYLDEGKPALASVAFYDSYKKWPEGERAAESLMYLGQALTRLKKPADACKVYDELAEVYAGKMSSAVRGGMEKGRVDAKCSA